MPTMYLVHILRLTKTNQSPGTTQVSGGFSCTPDWIRTSNLQSRSSTKERMYAYIFLAGVRRQPMDQLLQAILQLKQLIIPLQCF